MSKNEFLLVLSMYKDKIVEILNRHSSTSSQFVDLNEFFKKYFPDASIYVTFFVMETLLGQQGDIFKVSKDIDSLPYIVTASDSLHIFPIKKIDRANFEQLEIEFLYRDVQKIVNNLALRA